MHTFPAGCNPGRGARYGRDPVRRAGSRAESRRAGQKTSPREP